MPRTVEHIVACHQSARSRRKAGKPIWDKSIDVRSIIQEDQDNESAEHISAISQRIAKLIRLKTPASFFSSDHEDFDFDFVDTIESMEGCTVEALAVDKENGFEAVDMFNGWLDLLYDWADVNRIWLGK
jgi:hypothetical protein